MAQFELRFNDNAAGTYYVDSNCIACDTCVGIAPNHFRLTTTHDHAIVVAQPQTPAAIKDCEEAMACCPVNAIGNDGSPT
ncbi:ferredoxin [bacterium]|nr:ferredoxin [bacterium]